MFPPLFTTPPNVVPPAPPFLATEERAAKTAKGYAKAAAIVTTFGVIASRVPGPWGKLIAVAVAGLHKDASTGKVRPTAATATNALPAPLGWTDPGVYGLKPNWWLPEGGGWPAQFVPHWIGFGFHEQAAEDERLARERRARNTAAAVDDLRKMNPATLREIAAGNIGRAPLVEFQLAYGIAPQQVSFLARVALGEAELGNADIAAVIADVFRTFAPGAVKATNRDAQANEDRAEGINRELITERADP